MLNIGERITQLRKQQNLSQDELAKKAQVSRTIIGNYERNTNTPSIEVLIKLAKVFNVSVDFIIGEGELSAFDKDLLKRIEDIEKLNEMGMYGAIIGKAFYEGRIKLEELSKFL